MHRRISQAEANALAHVAIFLLQALNRHSDLSIDSIRMRTELSKVLLVNKLVVLLPVFPPEYINEQRMCM
jgi:hypothetical protein